MERAYESREFINQSEEMRPLVQLRKKTTVAAVSGFFLGIEMCIVNIYVYSSAFSLSLGVYMCVFMYVLKALSVSVCVCMQSLLSVYVCVCVCVCMGMDWV